MRQNIVLIDLENVQPESLELLTEEHFRVIVFVGANQTKLPFDFVQSVQRLGQRAEYVRIEGCGPNALDFHIAFTIGEIAAARREEVFFHIISRDAGFDPLIKYLKTKGILSARSTCIEEIPALKPAGDKVCEARAEQFAEVLRRPRFGRPRSRDSLASSVATFFNKQLSDQEVLAVVDALGRKGLVAFNGKKISYSLS